MALIKLGALTQDVRGTLNGNVFSRNRGGAYVRSKVSPVQPLSEYADFARQCFGSLSQRWSTVLTDEQRSAWEAFAAVHTFVNIFGDAIVLSGIAFYQAANRRLMQIAEDVLDDPPASWNVEDTGGVTLTIEAGGDFIIAIGRALGPNELLYVFGTPKILGARTPQRPDFRLLQTPANPLITPGADAYAVYNARFDPQVLVLGDRVAVRVQIINTETGASSSPALAQTTVIASS